MFHVIWEAFQPWLASTLVILITVAVLILARVILQRVARGRTGVPYKRQIASTLIVLAGVFAFVVLLPIDANVRGQILSVLGVLISAVIALSSTSLVGNAMAGVMMRLSKSYRPGDFIEVEDTIGRVTDHGLFHTEIQLITRDIVALPNLYLSRQPIKVTRSSGTFVSATVSLGYEIPSATAEEALREAVEKAELAEPFIMIEELLDHAITYRTYGLLEDTKELLSTRARLRRSIVTTLHARGLQIVSPSFVNRVEYPPDRKFVPERSADEVAENDKVNGSTEKVEAIAFDKAEEAESIDRLYALQEKLSHEQDQLDGRVKEAKSQEEKQKLREERKEVERRVKRTGEIIEKREAQQEKRELEEET